MKALFVNCSPRKNWNTQKLLERAMQGAKDSGAECELVNLYDIAFKGCVSCFACKLKARKQDGLCAFKDPLTPILEKARNSDVLVIGSPVYFSYPTAYMRAFLERFGFPLMDYSGNTNLDRKIQSALIFTMNAPEDIAEKFNYPVLLGANATALERLLGNCEVLNVYDTYQFSDYSRYEAKMFDPDHKAKRRDEQFPIELDKAYDLGKRLVERAK